MNLVHQPKPTELPLAGIPRAYADDVRLFNRFAAGRPLSMDLILEYFADVRLRYRPATIARKKAALKAALLHALGAGLSLGEHAQVDMLFKKVKTGSPPQRIISEKTLQEREIQELLAVSGEKTALLIRALYQTGCRISELLHIRLKDCRVSPRGVIIRVLGKRSKERFVYMKSDTFRTIKSAYRGTTYLFESKGKPLSRFTAHSLLKRAGGKIGRKDLHCHTLRHSLATNRLSTMTIDSLAEYLGHASPAITARFYCHTAPRLENVLGEI